MQLPLDIPELLKISTDLKEVSRTPISVSVFIDESASDELITHVRSAFAGAGAHTRVTIGYMDSDLVQVDENDDMAVLIAGEGDYVGRHAANIRDAGTPVMVVADNPALVAKKAEDTQFAIPSADIIAPEKIGHKNPIVGFVQTGCNFIGAQIRKRTDIINDSADESVDEFQPIDEFQPVELNEESFRHLDDRMGEWILAACSEKKLAMALAFSFVRRPLAYDSVVSTSMQNAAVGLVPLIPGADLPIMTLNQAKMVLQIAAAYDQPLDASRVKEIAAVVGGAFFFRNVARSFSKLIPGAGWLISGATGFVGTEAMGRAAIEYFEAGGDIVGLAKVVQSARDEAVDAAKKASSTPTGQKALDVAKSGASFLYSKVRNK